MAYIQSQAELLESFRRFSKFHTESHGYLTDRERFEIDFQTCFELRRLLRNKDFLTEQEFLEFIEIFNCLQWKGLEFFGESNPLTQLANHFNYLIKIEFNEFPDRYWKVILHKIDSTEKLIEIIKEGRKCFIGFNFTDKYDFGGQDLSNMLFISCTFTCNFRKTRLFNTIFTNCNLKACDFSQADLTEASIEECLIEGTNFYQAFVFQLIFQKNNIQSVIINEDYLLDFQCIGEPKQTLNN